MTEQYFVRNGYGEYIVELIAKETDQRFYYGEKQKARWSKGRDTQSFVQKAYVKYHHLTKETATKIAASLTKTRKITDDANAEARRIGRNADEVALGEIAGILAAADAA